jgi:hypothetical protein
MKRDLDVLGLWRGSNIHLTHTAPDVKGETTVLLNPTDQ